MLIDLSNDQIRERIDIDLQRVPVWMSKELLTLKRKCQDAYYHAEIIEYSKWIRLSEAEFA